MQVVYLGCDSRRQKGGMKDSEPGKERKAHRATLLGDGLVLVPVETFCRPVTGTRWGGKHCLPLLLCPSAGAVSVPVGSRVALYHWLGETLHGKQECVSTLKRGAGKKKKEWKPVWKQLYHNQMWLETYTKDFQGIGWYSSWDPRVTMQLISNISEVKYLKSH